MIEDETYYSACRRADKASTEVHRLRETNENLQEDIKRLTAALQTAWPYMDSLADWGDLSHPATIDALFVKYALETIKGQPSQADPTPTA